MKTSTAISGNEDQIDKDNGVFCSHRQLLR